MQPTERLNYAIRLFDDEKYFDAKTQFQILILNNPGSSFIDRAQFYLAECYFNMDAFITAAAEYEKLVKLYPQSDYADDAQFKIGAAYFELSPKYALDQTYTYKAIDALQLFLEEYPESDLVPLATEKLKICHTKLAKKAFETAEFYRKQGWPESALVYYDEVLKNYIDTNFADEAYYGKAYCLYELEKFDASRTVLQQLLAKFPGTALKEEIKELTEGILEANDTHSDSNT